MSADRWTAVDDYFSELFGDSDTVLETTLDASVEAGLPGIAVSPRLGRFLQVLAELVGARRILEIGTLGGFSTIWLARSLPADGQLISLELDPHHAEVARCNVARAGLSALVDIRVGRALDALDRFGAEGTELFDLVFIDADKTGYSDYLHAVVPLCRSNAVIVADNVVRNGQVADATSDDANVQGVRAFLHACAGHAQLSATALQTVGAKGYDGIAIARVR